MNLFKSPRKNNFIVHNCISFADFQEMAHQVEEEAHDEFWNIDAAWTELVNSIENAKRFVEAFNSKSANEYTRYLKGNFDEDLLLTIPVVNNSIDLDTICLKITENYGQVLPHGEGSQLRVTSIDCNILKNIDNYLLPMYVIKEPATPLESDICGECKCQLSKKEYNINCVSCGVNLCDLCTNHKQVLELGSNSKQPLCYNCSEKSIESNAVMWIKRAQFALNSAENSAARLFLEIGTKYASTLTFPSKNESPVSVAIKELEEFAAQPLISDYKIKILCLQYQGLKEFQWGAQAYKMCREGAHLYPYALACLKLINSKSSPDSRTRWEALGDKLGNYSDELALFCYNQCNFSHNQWTKKAMLYDDLASQWNKKTYFQISYHCIERGLERQPRSQHLNIVDQYFKENRHRLALYTLKASSVPLEVVLDLLHSWYNKVTKDYGIVIAIMKYIQIRVAPSVITGFPNSDPVLNLVKQLSQLPSTSVDRLIREKINNIYQVDEFLIPLALIKYKRAQSSWDELEEIANAMGCRHAARVFSKLDDIDLVMRYFHAKLLIY